MPTARIPTDITIYHSLNLVNVPIIPRTPNYHHVLIVALLRLGQTLN